MMVMNDGSLLTSRHQQHHTQILLKIEIKERVFMVFVNIICEYLRFLREKKNLFRSAGFLAVRHRGFQKKIRVYFVVNTLFITFALYYMPFRAD